MKKAKANGPAIDSKELIEALEELEKERGIKKDVILESIETALVTAYKRNFESSENVKVTMDSKSGETHVYAEKEVVEIVENPNLQINLADAQKLSKKLAIGDVAEIEIVPKNFGRIAAQTAKQVIVQKIREESRNVLFDAFNERKGEIVSGLVQKADGGVVVLDLGRLEGIMTVREQIPTEKYHVNDKLRAYVVDVERGAKGSPQVLVSRACPDFVRKLFELEIPEIYEGVIELKSVSRDPGSRSKVAVYSPNENIDPVGSCVGQKGIRIQNIINELSGEKIDVIEWNADPAIYISSALLPAQVMAVDIHEEEKFAQVIVPDDQLSLAIGKAGQNARLAAKLTNWKIDIKSESQFREMMQKAQEEAENAEEVVESAKTEEVIEEVEEKPVKKTTKKTTKKEEIVEEPVEEKKAKKATKKATEKEESEVVEEVKEENKTTKKAKAKKEEVADEAEEEPAKEKKTRKTKKKTDE
ncbi:MAG: transcription termination/antitermination protein NusA [Clostridia bacterium]|nr:transcription termination/antitermination protein NusA [Clostridia bacterium]